MKFRLTKVWATTTDAGMIKQIDPTAKYAPNAAMLLQITNSWTYIIKECIRTLKNAAIFVAKFSNASFI
jgi:hypothetical protein